MSVLDAIGLGAQALSAPLNFASQLMTNAQNERLMRESWGREDNAMQRKVTDLKAAGLNPVLAAGGSGAQSSGPIRMEAPQVSTDVGSRLLAARASSVQYRQTVEDAARAAAERRIAEAQADSVEQDNRVLRMASDLVPGRNLREARILVPMIAQTQQSELTGTNMAQRLYELEMAKRYEATERSMGIGSEVIRSILGILGAVTGPRVPWRR